MSGPGSESVPGFVITYFPVRGRCSAMRLLLADMGQEWKEVVVSAEEWFGGDLKETCVFGQLPKFQDDDLVLYQSNAILRHLGRRFGLYGINNRDAALIDMFNDGVEDLRVKYLMMIYRDYENGKADFIKTLPDELKYFERILKNNGGEGFLHGKEVTFVDYNLVDLLGNLRTLAPDCLKGSPLLQSYFQRVMSRPRIQAFVQSEAYTKLPINGNGKQ